MEVVQGLQLSRGWGKAQVTNTQGLNKALRLHYLSVEELSAERNQEKW
jgi:hypothetical protein